MDLIPWIDRTGRFSSLRLVAFVLVVAPGVWLALRWLTQDLGARPLETASRDSGIWGIVFLLAALAITPLRRMLHWSRVTQLRRMVGLAALAYSALHLGVYVVAQGGDLLHVASEIVRRPVLTIGFVAVLGLGVLGATSTDAAIKALGPQRWNSLHTLVYWLTALGLVHYLMQTKLDVTAPIFATGLFGLLMAMRLAVRLGWTLSAPVLAVVGLGVAVATALVEAGWYAGVAGAPFWAVLQANEYPLDTPRPGWWMLAVGGAVVVLALGRAVWNWRRAGVAA